MTVFISRHTLWLEKEIEDLKARHAVEVAYLKKVHLEELTRAITENQKLRDDLDRTRLLLTPALQSVELPKERSEPPTPSPDDVLYIGTPWQRVLARHRLNEERKLKEAALLTTVPAAASMGGSDGSEREGRVEAPLSEPSKTA